MNNTAGDAGDSKKHPIFQAMVKNFSQLAYINSGGKGLELYPQVSKKLLNFQSDEEEEGESGDEVKGESPTGSGGAKHRKGKKRKKLAAH